MSHFNSRPGRPRAQTMLKYAATTAAAAYGKKMISNVVSRGTPTPVVTDHNDAAVVYTKKRVNKKKYKKANKFKTAVKKAMEEDVSPAYQVQVISGTLASSANKQAGSSLPTLLGSYGTAGMSNDIEQLFARAYGYERIHLTGALMETMISNVGTNVAYLDCYYWSCKKSVSRSDALDIGGAWTAGLLELTNNAPVGGSSLDFQDYGVTPFQSRFLSQHINIYKKIRIKIGAGESTQLKVGKKLSTQVNKEYYQRHSLIKGVSSGILIIGYGTPSSTNPVTNPVDCRISINKNFTYKVLDVTNPSGGTNVA